MTRDQKRAQHAYERVRLVAENLRSDYKIAVNNLAANIMRSGLAAAVAFLQRRNDEAANRLIGDLATAGIPGLENTDRVTFPDHVRGLELEPYMLATRETLKVAQWFKRAVQATFQEQQ